MLNVNVEKAVNERELSEAIAANPEMQKLDKRHAELLSLDLNGKSYRVVSERNDKK